MKSVKYTVNKKYSKSQFLRDFPFGARSEFNEILFYEHFGNAQSKKCKKKNLSIP